METSPARVPFTGMRSVSSALSVIAAMAAALGGLMARSAPARASAERCGQVVRIEVRHSDTVLIPAGTFEMGYPATPAENDNAREQCLAELGELDPQYCPEDLSRPFYL